MKVRKLFEKLDEKQKRTILRCVERCGIPDLDGDIEPAVDEDTVKFLKVVSNPLRLAILKLLRDKWLCVCLISEALDQDQTLISHHLRTLKSLGLVEERKEGRMRFYRARRNVLEEYLNKVRGELLGE